LAGIALLILVAVRSRAGDVARILKEGGIWPLVAASLYRIFPVELNALAWQALLRGRRLAWRTMLRLRWIGEAVNALLPAAQVGGDLARARLLTAGGVPAGEATAAMVADVAISTVTQVLFTFAGAVALILGAQPTASARTHLGWLALVISVGVGFAALLVVVARLGVGRLLTALPVRLHGRLAARLRAGGGAIDRSLSTLRERPRVLLVSSGWHLAAWFAQVVETWMVLRLLGRPIPWITALAIESLAASARGAAFAVPGGIGVQEGALVAVGAAFGVPSAAALALGVIKRGRELVVGAPAIVLWALAERRAIASFWRVPDR
jgi:putative membrane protein